MRQKRSFYRWSEGYDHEGKCFFKAELNTFETMFFLNEIGYNLTIF
jgi:hypothetical protein